MYSKFLLQILTIIFFSNVLIAQNTKLELLVNEAIQVNPNIRSLNSKYQISKTKIDQGTSLPDPVLTFGLMNMPTNSFSFTQEPMTGKMIGLSQAIPFPTGLSSIAKMKSVDTSIVKREIDEIKNKIRKEVSVIYSNLKTIREKIEITEKSKILFKQDLNIIEQKYKVGSVSYQSIAGTEIQITNLDDKIIELNSEEKALVSKLNLMLFRNIDSPIETDMSLEIPRFDLDKVTVFKTLINSKPELQSTKLSIEKAKLSEDAATYKSYPNFNVGVQYSQRDHNKLTGADYNDFLSVVLGITLPLNYGGKNSAEIEEAKLQQSFFTEQLNYQTLELKKIISDTIEKLHALKNRIDLYNQKLIPQSENVLNSALVDFKVDKTDYSNVVKAQNDLLKTELSIAEIKNRYLIKIAELEYLIGKKLSEIDGVKK